ncbi:MAG: 2Fe-2S iron-sulfur cluster binding domain-containing protein [Gammaproteobacteria bacterium]|nr:2Fe-2S iron-sulfur cluster binding domain-containing protein [Gammaproteobacteria bacterium]
MGIGIFRQRRKYRDLESLPGQSQVADTAKEFATTEPAWDGFREFLVKRRVIEDDARSVCSFYLVPADGMPLPVFKSGQFLTFKLQLEDPLRHEPKTVVRCYSLSDRPNPDYYRVSIKRALPPAEPPDIPAGLSSSFFHDQVQEGTRLLVKAPSGHFHLMADDPLPIVLVGGGIGITPMLSILNTVMSSGTSREVWLYYGVCNGAEHVMKKHLESLRKAHPNFHLYVCYSSPAEGDVEGVDYHHRGRIDLQLLRSTLKLMRYQFYVCGPRQMMETLVPALEGWGVATDDIYYESFGPASLIKHETPTRQVTTEETAAQAFTITLSKSGRSIPWDPGTDSLLEFVEANGIEVESGCRAGSCGSCQTGLAAGEVDYHQAPDADVDSGHCLLCISTPKSDLTLVA